jgi:perosamine synthetase
MKHEFVPVAVPDIGDLEQRYVAEAMRSGWVSSIGEFIGRFESGFADFCEARHGIALANGTVAVEVALKALGVGPGDEVVVPALTFAAVGAVVVHLGAEPVLADVDPDCWCIDPVAAANALSPRTKAVVVVHSYGHPADLDRILVPCRARGVRVIEDAAEAHGARYRGRRVGALADAGCFSFYGNKIFTTGEGGMVVTNDDDLAARVRVLKDHAMDPSRRYYHLEAGYNFRMTNVQAALGCAQLERAAKFMQRRAEILNWYREEMGAVPEVRLNPKMSWAEPVNWLVSALLDEPLAAGRDALLSDLRREDGIDTRPFFVPMGEMPPYRSARRVAAVGEGNPVAERISRGGFNLPTSVDLDRAGIARIGSAVRRRIEALRRDAGIRG